MLIEGLKSHFDVEKRGATKKDNMPGEKLIDYGGS